MHLTNPYNGWKKLPRIRKRGEHIGRYNCLPPANIHIQQKQREYYVVHHIQGILYRDLLHQGLNDVYFNTAQHWEPNAQHNLYRSSVTALWRLIPQHRRSSAILPGAWCLNGSLGGAPWFDFCINELHAKCDPVVWQLYQDIAIHCGWLFAYEQACILCDRPTKITLDTENRLHAIGEPAIQYADGTGLYFYQGVALPDYMAQAHPDDWQAEWILTERNAELRRILIQGVDYAKICTDLQAKELSHWEDYTLLEIQDPVDIEPIHLLKMTCPSTGHIHAVRVPPTYRTARAALLWMNWGIGPEQFAQAT